jgi:hypothetical protein
VGGAGGGAALRCRCAGLLLLLLLLEEGMGGIGCDCLLCSALLGLTSPESSVFLPQLPWVWMKADRLDLFHELQISVSFSLRSQNTHTPKKIYIPIIFIHLCNPFIHSFMIFFLIFGLAAHCKRKGQF